MHTLLLGWTLVFGVWGRECTPEDVAPLQALNTSQTCLHFLTYSTNLEFLLHMQNTFCTLATCATARQTLASIPPCFQNDFYMGSVAVLPQMCPVLDTFVQDQRQKQANAKYPPCTMVQEQAWNRTNDLDKRMLHLLTDATLEALQSPVENVVDHVVQLMCLETVGYAHILHLESTLPKCMSVKHNHFPADLEHQKAICLAEPQANTKSSYGPNDPPTESS